MLYENRSSKKETLGQFYPFLNRGQSMSNYCTYVIQLVLNQTFRSFFAWNYQRILGESFETYSSILFTFYSTFSTFGHFLLELLSYTRYLGRSYVRFLYYKSRSGHHFSTIIVWKLINSSNCDQILLEFPWGMWMKYNLYCVCKIWYVWYMVIWYLLFPHLIMIFFLRYICCRKITVWGANIGGTFICVSLNLNFGVSGRSTITKLIFP